MSASQAVGPAQPSLRVAAAVTVAVMALIVYLRLAIYPNHLVPLTYALPLLLAVWHRDRRLLWGMAVCFLVSVVVKTLWLVPTRYYESVTQETLFWLMQWGNILIPAAVVHAALDFRDRLEQANTRLGLANAELAASNEELAAREEEICQQNEELQAQSEELEQQTEELRAQAEELQATGVELGRREECLQLLLGLSAAGEDRLWDEACAVVPRLLGGEVTAALVLQRDGDRFLVRGEHGVAPGRTGEPISVESTLAALVMERNEVGQLDDARLRPDIWLPQPPEKGHFRSVLSAPLRARGQPIGVLQAYGRSAHHWTAQESQLLSWLAAQCSLALEGIRLREELQAATAAAEAANQAKSQFLANMSHELRTPMNSILGMTNLALNEPLDATVRDYLETAKESAEGLLELLNQILDLSRIEARRFDLDATPFHLRHTVEQLVKSLAVRAHEKGLELVYDVPAEVPQRLVGDPLRLRQVLTNLVGNAIKFTHRGEIVVAVEALEQNECDVELRFSVTDTGIGIPLDDQERIFAPFIQADASSTRHYGGSGLGLAISANLVRMMNGRVSVESQPGRGSTFSFTVRLMRQQQPLPDPECERVDLEALCGLPALVIAESRTFCRILEQTLAHWKMTPTTAHDVPSGLAKIHQAAAAGKRFELVISDARLPGVDGFTLAEWLKKDPQLAGSVILLLSATDRQEQTGRHRELGVSWLEKPVAEADLMLAVGRALGAVVRDEPPAPADEVAAPPRPLKVLLAEDTPANQKLVARVLEKRGHQVVVAKNGQEAVELLDGDHFDLVLMDVQMPIMDGFQATQLIRGLSDQAKSTMPIIAMTAHALKGDQDRCIAAGMDDYLAKPVSAAELVAVVEGRARK